MWRMMWQSLYVRPHATPSHLFQRTRVYDVEDDVAGIICQTLPNMALSIASSLFFVLR